MYEFGDEGMIVSPTGESKKYGTIIYIVMEYMESDLHKIINNTSTIGEETARFLFH